MNSESNRLTSAEISHIWNNYTFASMLYHIMSYFLNNIEDNDIRTFYKYCHNMTRVHLDEYASIFIKEGLPVPRGTISEDINVSASRLFSDKFYINYAESMAKFVFSNCALAYTESSRDDIRKLFRDRVISFLEVNQLVTQVMISKNIYPKPPIIDVPTEVEFVKHENFFAGFFGEKRPLTSFSVKQLFYNAQNNAIGKALMMGFSQISQSKDIQEYFIKGKEISGKYVRLFTEKLLEEDITPPSSLESEVLSFSGSQAPFSDRLMLNHTVFLNAFGIGNYGLSLAQSQRRDLSAIYAKVIAEIGLYAGNGADLLIKNKWLEQPPLVSRRLETIEV